MITGKSIFDVCVILLLILVIASIPVIPIRVINAMQSSSNTSSLGAGTSDDGSGYHENIDVYLVTLNRSTSVASLIFVRVPIRKYNDESSFDPTKLLNARVRIEVTVTVSNKITGNVMTKKFTGTDVKVQAYVIPWAPGWYVIPIPSLPVITLISGNHYEVKVCGSVKYTIMMLREGSEVPVYSGFFRLKEGAQSINYQFRFLYAFVVDDLFNLSALTNTLGLSPAGWAFKENTPLHVGIIFIGNEDPAKVRLLYSVNDITSGNWQYAVGVSRLNIFDSVLKAAEKVLNDASTYLTSLGVLVRLPKPMLPLTIYEGILPGQPSGSVVRFKAEARMVDGSYVDSPSGLYYVCKWSGERILVLDPHVMLWNAFQYVNASIKPVVAVDLGHGEDQNMLDMLTSLVTDVKWKIIRHRIRLNDLIGVDVLIISKPKEIFDEQEINAIKAWLSWGEKAVWVGGDSDYGSNRTQIVVNKLLSELGSHLRLDWGEVVDDAFNTGKPYRVLGSVRPDLSMKLYTSLLVLGIVKPVLFHGVAPVVWIDDQGKAHNLGKEKPSNVIRIALSSNTAILKDFTSPCTMLKVGEKGPFALMAAEELSRGDIIVVSGESPFGGLAPMIVPKWTGVATDGPLFVKNTIEWLSLNTLRLRIPSFFPSSKLDQYLKTSALLSKYEGVNFHHWEYLARSYRIYISWPSNSTFDLLRSPEEGGYGPKVIILSNLGLGVNGSRLLDWDLADIRSARYGGKSLLQAIYDYVTNNNAGLIATYATLSDWILWLEDCKIKVGARGHVMPMKEESYSSILGGTVADMLGLGFIGFWEYLRDSIAKSLFANPSISLVVGSIPLLVRHVPWSGSLELTDEGKSLGWNIPDKINVDMPSMPKELRERDYRAYTVLGWQLGVPSLAFKVAVNDFLLRIAGNDTLMDVLGSLSIRRYSNLRRYSECVNSLEHILPGLVRAATSLEINVNDDGKVTAMSRIRLSNLGFHNNELITVSLNSNTLKELILKLLPLKVVYLSHNGVAGVVTYDMYWSMNGFRSVYFSFEVEASTSGDAQELLNSAVKWVSSWKFLGPINAIKIGSRILPIPPQTFKTWENYLGSASYNDVITTKTLLLGCDGVAQITLNVEEGREYVVLLAHPYLHSIKVDGTGISIISTRSNNNVTLVSLKSNVAHIILTIRGSGKQGLSVLVVKVIQEKNSPHSKPPEKESETSTTTNKKLTSSRTTLPCYGCSSINNTTTTNLLTVLTNSNTHTQSQQSSRTNSSIITGTRTHTTTVNLTTVTTTPTLTLATSCSSNIPSKENITEGITDVSLLILLMVLAIVLAIGIYMLLRNFK